jgi:hypothetical protein
MQNFDSVASRHNHLVQNAFGDSVEAQNIGSGQLRQRRRTATAAWQHGQSEHGSQAQAPAQNVAARWVLEGFFQNILKVWVRGIVETQIVVDWH